MIFFFFQAEDGIRDLTVTGVQTCALPILLGHRGRPDVDLDGLKERGLEFPGEHHHCPGCRCDQREDDEISRSEAAQPERWGERSDGANGLREAEVHGSSTVSRERASGEPGRLTPQSLVAVNGVRLFT